MPENAKARAGNAGKGGHGCGASVQDSSTPSPALDTPSDYRTIRESAYNVVCDDALDELAARAVCHAYQAGMIVDDECVPAEHREAMKAIADGVGHRLRERCMAYETVSRYLPAPEGQGAL